METKTKVLQIKSIQIQMFKKGFQKTTIVMKEKFTESKSKEFRSEVIVISSRYLSTLVFLK